MTDLAKAKDGDRVWLETRGLGGRINRRIATLERAAPKLLMVGAGRYERATGKATNRWNSSRVAAIATAKECAEYDAEQAEIKERQLQELAKDQKRKEFINSLSSLFEGARVSETEYGEDRANYYDVSFTRLTENEVRSLSAKVKAI